MPNIVDYQNDGASKKEDGELPTRKMIVASDPSSDENMLDTAQQKIKVQHLPQIRTSSGCRNLKGGQTQRHSKYYVPQNRFANAGIQMLQHKGVDMPESDQKQAQDAERKMAGFIKGVRARRQCNDKIEQILSEGRNEWTTLYTHPKLMGHYYWKDDSIHTRE